MALILIFRYFSGNCCCFYSKEFSN